jgi:hypothetical protein
LAEQKEKEGQSRHGKGVKDGVDKKVSSVECAVGKQRKAKTLTLHCPLYSVKTCLTRLDRWIQGARGGEGGKRAA